jgi:hypothetical protein
VGPDHNTGTSAQEDPIQADIELTTDCLPAAIGLNREGAWAGSMWTVTETFHGTPLGGA